MIEECRRGWGGETGTAGVNDQGTSGSLSRLRDGSVGPVPPVVGPSSWGGGTWGSAPTGSCAGGQGEKTWGRVPGRSELAESSLLLPRHQDGQLLDGHALVDVAVVLCGG